VARAAGSRPSQDPGVPAVKGRGEKNGRYAGLLAAWLMVTLGWQVLVGVGAACAKGQEAGTGEGASAAKFRCEIKSEPVVANCVEVQSLQDAGSPFRRVSETTPCVLSELELPRGRYRVTVSLRGWWWTWSGTDNVFFGDDTDKTIYMKGSPTWTCIPTAITGLILLILATLAVSRFQRGAPRPPIEVVVQSAGDLDGVLPDQDLPGLLGQTLRSERGECYQVIRLLGLGGMAAVFEVLHLPPGDAPAGNAVGSERWALKVPFKSSLEDPETRLRFLREVQICCRLSHPGLVQVLDWGTWGSASEYPFLVMELLNGRTLRQEMEVEGAHGFETGRIIKWFSEMLVSVEVIHAAGIVHRDLKPENVFVTSLDHVKVMDFGVAGRVDSHSMTVSGTSLGTPLYMTVEHLEARTTTPASDIYSLGVILYEMLCGRPPFQADNVFTLLQRMMSEEPSPPSSFRSDLAPELEDLALRMMSRQADLRPSGAECLAILDRLAVTLEEGASAG
jgi:hypothetical protein